MDYVFHYESPLGGITLGSDGNESGHLRYKYKDKKSALKKFGLVATDNTHLNNAGKVLFSVNAPVMLKL